MSETSGTSADLSGFTVAVEHWVPAVPERVWALVSDLPGMAARSPEVVALTWDDREQRSFSATNARGGRTWHVTGHVLERDAPRRLRWAVSDPDRPSSTWSYELHPDGDGTRVVHAFVHGPGSSLVRQRVEADPASARAVLDWRAAMLREDMAASLRSVARELGA